MRHATVTTLLGLVFASVACGAETGGTVKLDPTLVNGNNQFAFDLYAKLRQTEGNLFFSPASVSTAFAMTYVGARGETAGEMSKVFRFPQDVKQTNSAFAALVKHLNGDGKDRGYALSIANALWGQKSYSFQEAYLATLKDSYGAPLHPMDFVAAPEPSRQEINQWVAKQTNDRIKDLLAQGTITADTRLILTNAIYFKGDWAEKFDAKLTQAEADFILAPGKKAKVPMMNRTGQIAYAAIALPGGAKAQMVELPYKNDELSMLVLLPDKVDGLEDVEKALSADKLAEWAGQLRKQEVHLSLPKFKTSSEFTLKATLSSMGMPLAFGGRADFSGMTGKPDLYIYDAVHKAFVDVNEEGTEAAGATGIHMRTMAARTDEPVFRADHPFVFVIREKASGAVLFVGRLSNPS